MTTRWPGVALVALDEYDVPPVSGFGPQAGVLLDAMMECPMIHRARYTFERIGSAVFIVDLNEGRSVTNDAEAVIRDLVERGIEVDRALIVYQDSTGLWDQLRTRRSEFAGVRALGARDRIEAIQRARR